MERILPISNPKSFDCYHDSLTHHYSAPVFYDALQRELSFVKREGNIVGIVKFELLEGSSEDLLLFFANELELAVRQHDLIARIGAREFAVLLRLDIEIESAFKALVSRLKKFERREFKVGYVSSDGTKGLAQVLEELDNPQILHSSKML
jgi:GGDEF domain-containing protein